MQNGIASAKKITVYDEGNIWHSDFCFNWTEKPLLDSEILWAVRDHWQHIFLGKTNKQSNKQNPKPNSKTIQPLPAPRKKFPFDK